MVFGGVFRRVENAACGREIRALYLMNKPLCLIKHV